MHPARKNKIDISQLTDEEQKMFRMYGKLPDRKDVVGHRLKERKYFDSGDYALSKAGKATLPVGSAHPRPETIPHSNPNLAQHGSSPVKESSLVREAPLEADISKADDPMDTIESEKA
ncbi:uncharacterized protein VTP21DRAFT_1387 [Calcarisporiella thermophila]|uniref:uncharacterized protein n=1 Tax=Calcarisporiella thermophila TaxID=911321 RepID=UPI0037434C5C